MSKRKKQIEEFFSAYEENFNHAILNDKADMNLIEEITGSFANCFVESSPLGVVCGKNDSQFLERISQGFDLYKSIGTRGMNIISKDVTLLDDLHAIVKIYWRYSYAKENNKGTIDFNTFYLVNSIDSQVKIVAYVTGDEMKALREKGLVPQEAEREMTHS